MIYFVEKIKLEPFIQKFSGQKSWHLESLKGGLLNQNYFLIVGANKFVLKVYRPEMIQAKIMEMHRLMKFVANHSIPVACPLEQENIDGHEVVIYPFIVGTHPPRYRNTKDRIRSMGSMLGKIDMILDYYKSIIIRPSHEELIKLFNPSKTLEQIKLLCEELRSHSYTVRRELNGILNTHEGIILAQTWNTDIFNKLPIRYIQGDYHIYNLLMKDNKIMAVLDWEKSGWNFRGFEIMRSIIFNCRQTASELSWPLIEEYLQAYRQHADVSAVEAELAFECGYRRVVFSFWAIRQYLAGHKHFRQNILRRIEMIKLLTKHRLEYSTRIQQLLSQQKIKH